MTDFKCSSDKRQGTQKTRTQSQITAREQELRELERRVYALAKEIAHIGAEYKNRLEALEAKENELRAREEQLEGFLNHQGISKMFFHVTMCDEMMGRAKRIRTLKEFQSYERDVVPRRLYMERMLAEEHRDAQQWYVQGYCEWCGMMSSFLVDRKHLIQGLPNFRERLCCQHCGLNARQRLSASFIRRSVIEGKINSIYVHEQVTEFYRKLCEMLQGMTGDILVVGSEYLGQGSEPGKTYDQIRHEDAMNLSFDDASFGLIVSNDVFEHVPDVEKALREAARILAGDGKMIFTIPFMFHVDTSVKRAIIVEGEVIHLLPAVYHGNPIDPKGSLVFHEFGWDLFHLCEKAGFRDGYLVDGYNPLFGYMSHFGHCVLPIFVAEK